MLSAEASDVLGAFAETNFQLPELAAEREVSVPAVWNSLVAATLELGASSVEEAAMLAQVGRPKAAEQVPA